MGGQSDVDLIRQALDGSKGAAQELAERLDPVIRQRVEELRGSRADGEDAAQRVWTRLLPRLSKFSPDRGLTLEGFAAMIARQEVIDLWRCRSERFEVLVDSAPEPRDPSTPEEWASVREVARRLRAHLDATLPVRGRLVLRLLYDDGRSDAEAAEILGVSRQVIANWKHKIRTIGQEFHGTMSEGKKNEPPFVREGEGG